MHTPLPTKTKKHPLWILGALLILLGPFGIGLGTVLEENYSKKALVVQRVKVDKDAGDLFGGDAAHTPVGSPQELIIEDPKAFLDARGPEGTKLVDEDYLQENKIYPLQLKTVRVVSEYARYGFVALALFGALLLWIGSRLRRKSAAV